MNTFKYVWLSGGARSFVKLAGTMTALGALLTVTARSSGELATSGAMGAGGTAAQAPASEPGSSTGGTDPTQRDLLDPSVRAFVTRLQAQPPRDLSGLDGDASQAQEDTGASGLDGGASQVQEDAVASPAPAFAALNNVVNLSAVPPALTTYPLSADGKYYNVNLLNRNFLPPTAHATFSNGVSQLGAAGPQFVFDGGDTAFSTTAGDQGAMVTLTVDMGQYFSIGAVRPLYQPLGSSGDHPVSQRIRFATKLGPQADWQTVVESPVASPDTTLSFNATPGRYLELTMLGNGCNLLELFVFPSAQTSPPPTYASGYDVTSLASTQSVNENFFPPGAVWPVSWPAGGFYPKSHAPGDAVATVDLGAQYPISRVTASFFWSTPWANGGRLEIGVTPEAYTILRDSGPGHDFGLSLNFPFPTQPVRYLRATDYSIPGVGPSEQVLWSLHAFATPSPHVGYYPLSADGKYFEVNLLRRPTGDVQPTASVVYSNGALPYIFDPLGRIAGNVLDGDDLPFNWSAASGTFSDATATVTVDLGQVQSIGAVRQLYQWRPLSSSLRVAPTLAGPWQQVLENTPITAADNTSSFDSTSARYVELTMKGTTSVAFANLLELRVYPANLTDPAPSSGSHLDLTYLTGMTPVVNANMGRAIAPRIHSVAGASGYYIKTAAQGGTGDATVTVDLGQQYQISEIVLSWFANGIWPAGGKIDVDDGSGNWVTVFDSGHGAPLGPAADGAQRFSFAPRAARSVRLTGYFDPAAAPSGFLEGIEVFGDNVPCVASCAGKICGDSLSDGCGGTCTGVCGAGQVGCRADTDCTTGLVCQGHVGNEAAPTVCVAPGCIANPQSLGCGIPGAACGPTCTQNWICTSDSNCAAGYVCGVNNGFRYGLPEVRVCERPSCETAPGETGCGTMTSECGLCSCTPNCAGKHCGDTNVSDGCGNTCAGLCAARQGGCQNDAECQSGDVCVANAGVRVGQADGLSVCLPAVCRDPIHASLNCGSVNSPCGICPAAPQDACAGLECGIDPTFGVACGDMTPADKICVSNRWVDPPLDELRTLIVPVHTGIFHTPNPVAFAPLSLAGLGTGATPGAFAVTDRGAARYSIPIAVPPGRAGVAPSLALTYLSTKTNGYLGVGFTLSGLSAISTCGRILATDGEDRAVQDDGSDPYCLDGQRLIQVAPGEYRTEIDTFVKVVEGPGLSTPPGRPTFPVAGFTTFSKDGRIRRYLPLTWHYNFSDATPKIRTWALAREEDRSGNTIDISYEQHPATDCPALGCDIVEAVPHSITYGSNTVAGLGYDRHVDFSYTGDRPDHLLGYASGGLAISRTRLMDSIKTFVGNKLVHQYTLHYETSPATSAQRIHAVQDCASGYFSGTTSCHSPTIFTYNDPPAPTPVRGEASVPRGSNDGIFFYSSPSFSVFDADGDGYLDLTSLQYGAAGGGSFSVTQTNLNTGAHRFLASTPAGPVFYLPYQFPRPLMGIPKSHGSNPIDYDSLHSLTDEIRAGIDKDRPFPTPTLSGALPNAAEPRLIDVDGDEIQDLLFCSVDGPPVKYNDDSRHLVAYFAKGVATGGFDPDIKSLPSLNQEGISCNGIDSLDLDGDGRPELTVDFALLHGNDWSAHADHQWEQNTMLRPVGIGSTLFADVNGDGLKDLVSMNPTTQAVPIGDSGGTVNVRFTRFLVAINHGGFFSNYEEQGQESDTLLSPADIHVADVNGDHCDDLLYTDVEGTTISVKYGSPTAQLSSASVYVAVPALGQVDGPPTPAHPLGRRAFVVVDLNNDGAPDITIPGSDGNYTILSNAAQQDLLTKIIDGEARQTEITYDPAAYDARWSTASPVSEGEIPCAWPARCDRSVGPVVSRTVLSSGSLTHSLVAFDFRPERTQNFSYAISRHGALGRSSLGFESRTITTLDGTGALIGTTEIGFDNFTFDEASKTFPFAGLVRYRKDYGAVDQSEQEAAPGRSFQDVVQNWQLFTSASSRPAVTLGSRSTQHLEIVGDQTRLLLFTDEQFSTDTFGNVYSSSATEYNAQFQPLTLHTVDTTFRTDLQDAWLIGLPRLRTVTDTVYPAFNGGAATQTQSLETGFDFNDRGILTFLVEGGPGSFRDTEFIPDAFGNIQDIDVYEPIPVPIPIPGGGTTTRGSERKIHVDFEERHQFPKTIKNSLDQETQLSFDPSLGTLLTAADPNNKVTQNGYDEYGRLLLVASPSGVVHRSYGSVTFVADTTLRAVAVATASDSTGGSSTDYLDAFGRSVRSISTGLQGKQVVTDRVYAQSGYLQSETRPHLDGDTSQGNVTHSYDKRRRLISTSVNGVVTKFGYASAVNCSASACPDGVAEMALQSSTSPRDSSVKLTILDQRGEPRRVNEGGVQSSYTYGPFGKLQRIGDPEGNQTVLEYDDLLRLHHLADPDKGAETYQYNAFGELESVVEDVTGHSRSYERDALGRNVVITDSIDGTTRFCFDSACDQPSQPNETGNLVESVSPTGIRTRAEFENSAVHSPAAAAAGLFAEVNRGFLLATHRTIPASVTGESADEEFVTSYSYNDKSLLSRIDYPASGGEPFGVNYGYDAAGNLDTLRDANGSTSDPHATFWHLTDTDQGLRPTAEVTGDGTTVTRSFDPLLGFQKTLALKTNAATPADSQTLQDLAFGHYADGLLQSVTQPSGAQTLYSYDALGRLTTASSGITITVGTQTIVIPGESKTSDYSPSGNITSQTDLGAYTYDPSAHHRATLVDGTTYDYRDNGDIWHRSGKDVVGDTQEFVHTGFHLPKRVLLGDGANGAAQQEVAFDYDAAQDRAFKHSPLGDRLYVGDTYQRFTPTATGPHAFPGETREHLYKVYAPGNLLIQVVRGEQAGSITDQSVLYVHADQQGSPAVIRDQDGGDHGKPSWTTTGAPAGAASWESSGDPLARTVRTTYTGHEFDEELGLTNMRGRIYDQKIGRFLQADPMVQAPLSTQGLNRYSYVFNSPVNFVDPSGFDGVLDGVEFEITGCNESCQQAQAEAQARAQAEGQARGQAAAAAAEAQAQAQAQAAHAQVNSGQPVGNPDPHQWGQDDFYPGAAQAQAGAAAAGGRDSRVASFILAGAQHALDYGGSLIARDVVVPFVNAAVGGNEAGGAVDGQSPAYHRSAAEQLLDSAAFFAIGAIAKFGAGKLAGAAAEGGGAVILDTNAIIASVERGQGAAILAGRTPVVPITAAKEFLQGGGSAEALRGFLGANGGRIGVAGSESTAAALRTQAAVGGRVLGLGDSRVAASAQREGLSVVTQDRSFRNFLNWVGIGGENF